MKISLKDCVYFQHFHTINQSICKCHLDEAAKKHEQKEVNQENDDTNEEHAPTWRKISWTLTTSQASKCGMTNSVAIVQLLDMIIFGHPANTTNWTIQTMESSESPTTPLITKPLKSVKVTATELILLQPSLFTRSQSQA